MTCTIVTGMLTASTTKENWGNMAQKQRILITILELYRQGYTDFYVNCERGVSLWAAEAVCLLKNTLKIELHIIVPFENQCEEWLESERDRYYKVHEAADSVTFACRQFQPDCYQIADSLMINHSDFLLVFGKKTLACYAVTLASQAGVPVQHIPI